MADLFNHLVFLNPAHFYILLQDHIQVCLRPINNRWIEISPAIHFFLFNSLLHSVVHNNMEEKVFTIVLHHNFNIQYTSK